MKNSLKHVSSIIQLFDLYSKGKEIYFKIPSYQRSYSWDAQNAKQFYIDLKENIGNRYYLGHYIFNPEGQSNCYNVVDGQQRPTTILIFLRSILEFTKKYNL